MAVVTKSSSGKYIVKQGNASQQPQQFAQDFAQGFGKGLNILNPMVNGGNANIELDQNQNPRYYYASGKSRALTPQELAEFHRTTTSIQAAPQVPGNFGQDFAQGFSQGVNPATYINPFINGLNTPSNAQPQNGYFMGGKYFVPNKQ